MLELFKGLSHLSRLINKNLYGVTLLKVFLHHWEHEVQIRTLFFFCFFFSHPQSTPVTSS